MCRINSPSRLEIEVMLLAIIICLLCLCWVLPGMGSFAVDMNNAPHLGHHWYLPQPPVYSWFGSNVKSKLLHLYYCNRPRSIHCVSVLRVSPHFKCLDWIQTRLRDPNDGADMANFHAYSLLYEKKIPWGKSKALSSKQSANNFICRKRIGFFLLAEYFCLICSFLGGWWLYMMLSHTYLAWSVVALQCV